MSTERSLGKRIILLLSGLLALLVAFLIVAEMLNRAGMEKRLHCQEKMRALWMGVYFDYRLDHNNTFPPTLKKLLLEPEFDRAPGSPSFGNALLCPGSGTKLGQFGDADEWQDYIYIDWSRYYGTTLPPSYYPIIYDRRLSNHGGAGINVVSVEGAVDWDPDAAVLRKFAADHPEYETPLPQEKTSTAVVRNIASDATRALNSPP